MKTILLFFLLIQDQFRVCKDSGPSLMLNKGPNELLRSLKSGLRNDSCREIKSWISRESKDEQKISVEAL